MLLLKFILDNAQKIIYIAQAPNLLRSKEHQVTFLELLEQSKPQETLDFDIEKVSYGLNERTTLETISIPKEEILESKLKSCELAKDIATKYS